MRRSLVAILTTALMVFGGQLSPAHADAPAVDVTVSGDGYVSGTISGFDPAANLFLTVQAVTGSLSLPDGALDGVGLLSNQLTHTADNQTIAFSRGMQFQGTQDRLNAQLHDMVVQNNCGSTFNLNVQVSTVQIAKNLDNGHFYMPTVALNSNFDTAVTEAANLDFPLNDSGTKGYLATVTSASENQLLGNIYNYDLTLGATDETNEGTWNWVSGPEAGTNFTNGNWPNSAGVPDPSHPGSNFYTSWNPGEPNDWGGGEDYLVMGREVWNDSSNDGQYLVEWGGQTGDNLEPDSSLFVEVNSQTENGFTRLDGDGTATSPYLINNLEDSGWAANSEDWGVLCGVPDAFFQQTTNLYLPDDWTSTPHGFFGNYDGDGNTIWWGLGNVIDLGADNKGIFDSIGNPNPDDWSGGMSTIKNLTISGNAGGAGYSNVGMLAGTSDHVVISNVSSGESGFGLTAGGSGSNENQGGLVGNARNTVFDGITSHVSITSDTQAYNIGAIAGGLDLSSTIMNSTWDGSMSITGDDGLNVAGGLAAGAYGNSRIIHNTVSGTITADGHFDYIGGIVGDLEEGALVKNNKSSVTISAPLGSKVGGLVGNSNAVVVENMVVNATIDGGNYTGGLVGNADSDSEIDNNAVQNTSVTSSIDSGNIAGLVIGHQGGALSRNVGTGTVSHATSRGAIGEDGGSESGVMIWSPTDVGVTVPGSLITGENPKTLAEIKTLATYSDLNFDISAAWSDGHIWTLCAGFNSNLPFITALYTVDPCTSSTPVLGKSFKSFYKNAWWLTKKMKNAVKAYAKTHKTSTRVKCVGVVSKFDTRSWQKKVGLGRAQNTCAIIKRIIPGIHVTYGYKVAAKSDKLQRGVIVTFE